MTAKRRTAAAAPLLLAVVLLHLCLVWQPGPVMAGRGDWEEEGVVPPNRYGVSAIYGHTFDPGTDRGFVMVSAFGLFDYAKIWHHRAPKRLRFKVEGTLGLTTAPQARFMTSISMLALYFMDIISTKRLRPYLEGGIGLIYTDFQVPGQGMRFNFNPQAGLGMEIKVRRGQPFFIAARIHHISNAGIHHDNRGVNSALLMVGRFVK